SSFSIRRNVKDDQRSLGARQVQVSAPGDRVDSGGGLEQEQTGVSLRLELSLSLDGAGAVPSDAEGEGESFRFALRSVLDGLEFLAERRCLIALLVEQLPGGEVARLT